MQGTSIGVSAWLSFQLLDLSHHAKVNLNNERALASKATSAASSIRLKEEDSVVFTEFALFIEYNPRRSSMSVLA